MPYPLMTIKGRSLTSMLDGRPGLRPSGFMHRLDRGREAFGPRMKNAAEMRRWLIFTYRISKADR